MTRRSGDIRIKDDAGNRRQRSKGEAAKGPRRRGDNEIFQISDCRLQIGNVVLSKTEISPRGSESAEELDFVCDGEGYGLAHCDA